MTDTGARTDRRKGIRTATRRVLRPRFALRSVGPAALFIVLRMGQCPSIPRICGNYDFWNGARL